jgi:hypothetical protein
VYSDGFRHLYSGIFTAIHDLNDGDPEGYNVAVLANNMQILRGLARDECLKIKDENAPEHLEHAEQLYGNILKLSDHISLEQWRHSEFEERNEEIRMVKEHADQIVRDAEERVSHLQTQLVVILGVFAAIVIAFSGGLTFIGQSLSGIDDAPVFKSTFVVALCGVVIFNMIALLMQYIAGIIGKDIGPKWYGHSYILWFNVALATIIGIDILAWYHVPLP